MHWSESHAFRRQFVTVTYCKLCGERGRTSAGRPRRRARPTRTGFGENQTVSGAACRGLASFSRRRCCVLAAGCIGWSHRRRSTENSSNRQGMRVFSSNATCLSSADKRHYVKYSTRFSSDESRGAANCPAPSTARYQCRRRSWHRNRAQLRGERVLHVLASSALCRIQSRVVQFKDIIVRIVRVEIDPQLQIDGGQDSR